MGRMPYHSLFSTYSRKDREIATTAMDRLDIHKLKDRPYTEISGGERQLAMIARSIARGLESSSWMSRQRLDYGNQMRLLADISGLAGRASLYHDHHFPDHALMTADRVILFNHGAVIADGRPEKLLPEIVLRPLPDRVNVAAISGANGTAGSVFPPGSGESLYGISASHPVITDVCGSAVFVDHGRPGPGTFFSSTGHPGEAFTDRREAGTAHDSPICT
jgi:iron complex transport system ATP-binding protein